MKNKTQKHSEITSVQNRNNIGFRYPDKTTGASHYGDAPAINLGEYVIQKITVSGGN